MSKAQPFFLHEDFEPADGPVVPVQHEHGQRRQLGGAVPTIAAVHHHRRLPGFHSVSNAERAGKNELQNSCFF